ncbi:MAG TPA: hypothetical protein VFJ64_06605 [Solirubrobacterales bacterium]|nr:hypothetical protein [Solirubrobacterales bacterium]
MKALKTLGLAALAALMAMVFLSAGSAMAEETALCGADEAVCTSPITRVHETSVGKAVLLANPKIECNVLFLGEATVGSPLVVEGNFTYSNCTSGCAVTEEGAPSVIEVLREGHETASVVGEGEIHVNCPGIDCYYNGEGLAGTAKGPLLSTQKNGEVSLQEWEVHKTKGTFCPATGKLDITTTPLSATYISTSVGPHRTALCASDEEECTKPLTHVHETSVGKAILLASPKVECNVLFLGEAHAGSPLVVEGNFTYSSCGSGCTVTEEGGPSVLKVAKEGHETADVFGEGEVHINCIGINCFYNGKELIATAKGPLLSTQANGEVSIQEQTVHKTKGTFCPSTGKLDITTTPLSATYITE